MPATSRLVRVAAKACCIALTSVLAACGGGGEDGAAVASACSGTRTAFTPPAPPPGAPTAGLTLGLLEINSGFALTEPLFVTAPPGDSNRLFVVEKGGTIR